MEERIELQQHDCIMYDRVRDLELSSTAMDERLIALCDKLSGLTTAIWCVFSAIIVGTIVAIVTVVISK